MQIGKQIYNGSEIGFKILCSKNGIIYYVTSKLAVIAVANLINVLFIRLNISMFLNLMDISFLQIIHTRFQNVAQEGNTFTGEVLYLKVNQNIFK